MILRVVLCRDPDDRPLYNTMRLKQEAQTDIVKEMKREMTDGKLQVRRPREISRETLKRRLEKKQCEEELYGRVDKLKRQEEKRKEDLKRRIETKH